jgi:hypothetical protein
LKEKLIKIRSGPSFYDIPTTLNTKATNFGIGEKKASYIMDPKTPGPNKYEIKRIYESFENA